MTKVNNWPSISIPEADREIIKKIAAYPGGVLQGIEAQDALMLAAALAIKSDIPETTSAEGKKVDVVHQGLLRDEAHHEYRQYMLLIYYLTGGKRDLNRMSDFREITKNFVEYAHRGLQMLKMLYLKPDGSEGLEGSFREYVGEIK